MHAERKRAAVCLLAALVTLAGAAPQSAGHRALAQASQAPHQDHGAPQSGQQTSDIQVRAVGPALTLAEIERRALANNPTLGQAEAAIRAAQGRRRQAGLWPNPIVGYEGEEFAFRSFNNKSVHSFFIEQTIPLGGKLSKGRRVFEREAEAAEAEAAAQRQRVLNAVRVLYYDVLGAQQRVALREELARIAREAVAVTGELLNVGQADRPDYLESEIEAQQVELDLINARNDLAQAWQVLAAVIGAPQMEPALLAGNLEAGLAAFDPASMLDGLLAGSPDLKRARAEIERARAAVARARAQRAPDLFLRGSIGYSNELLEAPGGPADRKTGPEASVEIGISLPLFNRNQGGIEAAEAELAIAEREAQRVELALRMRLAQAVREYNNARSAVERYQKVIVPRAEQAYRLYLTSFRQMAASYPQVIIAQRTLFQVREDYLNALVGLRQNAVRIEGFLLGGGLDAPRRAGEASGAEAMGGAGDGH